MLSNDVKWNIKKKFFISPDDKYSFPSVIWQFLKYFFINYPIKATDVAVCLQTLHPIPQDQRNN